LASATLPRSRRRVRRSSATGARKSSIVFDRSHVARLANGRLRSARHQVREAQGTEHWRSVKPDGQVTAVPKVRR
jgi:hypothetical protein